MYESDIPATDRRRGKDTWKQERAARRADAINRAFSRAALEEQELRRLKALHPKWPGLHFDPKRLGRNAEPTTNTEKESDGESS